MHVGDTHVDIHADTENRDTHMDMHADTENRENSTRCPRSLKSDGAP